jgi:hypothetical protein
VPWVVSLIPIVVHRTGCGAVRTLIALGYGLSVWGVYDLLGKVQVIIVDHTREDDQVPVSRYIHPVNDEPFLPYNSFWLY